MTVTTRDVLEDEADIRLDRWFKRHFPQLTQGTIQKFCRTGQIRVDGKRAGADTRLAPGQTVRIPPLPADPAPRAEPMPPSVSVKREIAKLVIYQDDQVILINKPPGLAVQGGSGIVRHLDGMLEALRFGFPDRPRLVHRIDMDTSGLLLLARTPGVAAKLSDSFRSRQVEKTYWAVVAGRPVPVEGRIDQPLVKFGGLRGERSAPAEPGEEGASRAVTDFRTLEHAARKLAWLELRPITGRTHQLRVHCAAIGAPIVWDTKYGGEKAKFDGIAEKLHLHARALVLPHPAGGTLEAEADLPEHMQATFKLMGFSARAAQPVKRR